MITSALLGLWATCALPVSCNATQSATRVDRGLTLAVGAHDDTRSSDGDDVWLQPVFPVDGAAGVAATSLEWTPIAGAEYELSLGTSNPPPLIKSGLRDATYAIGALTPGSQYFWRVKVRSADGTIAQGPLWSFSTASPKGARAPTATTTSSGSGSTANASASVSAASSTVTAAAPSIATSTTSAAALTVAADYATTTTSAPITVAAAAATAASAPVTVYASPTAYAAITNRASYPKPPVPALGPAGYSLTDPTFGSRILRVTDGNTRPGAMNRSYRVASNAHLASWNATSTGFYVVSNDGTAIPYSFDAATMTARRINATSSGDGGLTLAFYVEPQYSLTNPNLIYGVSSRSNNRTITQFDFSTGGYSTVVDLDTVVGGLAGTYVGGMITGGSPENLVAFFGGGSQDSHFYLLWTPIGNLSARKLLNTASSTINGRGTNVSLNFRLHSAAVDRSGRYVFLYPTSVDLAAPRSAAQVYLWDTQTDNITALGVSQRSGGHDAHGFGYWVNQDCCTSSSWDAMQWQFRSLDNPTATSDLISPILMPKEIYINDHTTWNNARADALVPVISSTYRYYGANNTTPWRAWDDEIIAVDTTDGVGGTVWRFAHHRSNSTSDSDPSGLYFWYEPIASVSPDGRWVLFTSNWEKTLGRDSAEPFYRQDVFIVQLLPSGAPTPAPLPRPAPAPATPPAAPPVRTAPAASPAPASSPTPPSDGAASLQLTSTVSGSTVTLDWQTPNGATLTTSYVVEAGSAPGLSDVARIDATTAPFVVVDVPPGVYFVRVRAANGAHVGTASNETVVTVGGSNMDVLPGAPANLTMEVSGREVTLRWNSGQRTSEYIVEAGSAPGQRDLAYIETGSSATVFVASDVIPRVYYVRIRGWNSSGVGYASNEVVVDVR